MDDNHQPIDKSELLKNLTGRFSKEELKTLSFQLGVDWDELEGAAQTLRGAETAAIGLGSLLCDRGNYEGVRPYYERALAIFTAGLGDDHPHTRIVRGNLARLLERISQAS